MLTRIASGLTLLAIVLAVVIGLSPWGTIVMALVVVALASDEFAQLAKAGTDTREAGLSAVVTALAIATNGLVQVVLFAVLVVVAARAVGRGRPDQDVIRQAGVALGAPVYIGVPAGLVCALRTEFGPWALLAGLLTVMASDTAQLFGGRAWGRHLLAPVVSPKKTVEGAVAGVAAAALVLPGLGHWWLPQLGWPVLAGVGAVMGLLGIAGDLFESLLKRSAGVKDSSALIPGHGGMLDRVDAILFAVPFLYVVLRALSL